MALYEFEHKHPLISPSSFVHPEAVLIGSVEVGERCFIGPGVVIRGDYGKIVIGNGSNVQDNCMIHADVDAEAIIGDNVLIGHSAVIHGPCVIGEYSVIGMGAIVSMGCEIGRESMLAAGSLLPPRGTLPPRKLAMGSPAAVVRDLNDTNLARHRTAVKFYQELAQRYMVGLKVWDGSGTSE